MKTGLWIRFENVSMNSEPNHSARMPAVFARTIAAAMRKDDDLSDRDIFNILRLLYCTNEQRRAASQQAGMRNRWTDRLFGKLRSQRTRISEGPSPVTARCANYRMTILKKMTA